MSDGQVEAMDATIIAIGASAGGLHALGTLLGALPTSLPVPVVVVQHLDPKHPSHLAEILQRRCSLEVRQAQDGDPLRPGVVLIAPPNHHLRVTEEGTVSLDQAEPVRFARPSVDLLLESVGAVYGSRAVAVVLTGSGSDGVAGVEAVSGRSGTVVVQDPTTAEFQAMPAAAVATGLADRVLPLEDLGPALAELVGGAVT